MIEKSQIKQACRILRDVQEKFHGESKKINLLEDKEDGYLYLQFTLKKIPNSKSIKMIKVQMPHSIFGKSKEVCLITGDSDKKNHKADVEGDILHYKELLKKHGITAVSEVVTLRQLRTDYKPYEAKQKLLAAYDVFLADKKIVECLPRVLGKHFFKKRKFPIQIDLKSPNLKKQVEKALSTKVFYVTGHGNSCCSEVAYVGMDNADIIDNVMKVANTLCDELPGSWSNVMGVYLKTSKSKAIPLFMSYDGFKDVKISEESEISCIEGELSTLHNAAVTVFSDGRVSSRRMIQNGDGEKEENDESSLSQEGEATEGESRKSKKEKIKKPELIVLDELQDSDQANSVAKKRKISRKKSTGLEDSDQANSVGKKIKKSKRKSTSRKAISELNEVSQEEEMTSIKSKKEDTMEPTLVVLDELDSDQDDSVGKKIKKSKRKSTSRKSILSELNEVIGSPVKAPKSEVNREFSSQDMEKKVSNTDGSQSCDTQAKKAHNSNVSMKQARTKKRKSKM